MIRALTFTIIFFSAVVLFSNCEDENTIPRSYPRVKTLSVTNITEKGASISADIYSLGTEKIIEHGFVWGLYEPSLSFSDRVYLGPCENTGIFKAELTASLRKDIKYIVKPFIQTADHIVYGIPVTFKSLGSDAPVIESYEPHSATWFDTLTIRGKNFSWIPGENSVKLNQTVCDVVGATNTTLKVLVSPEISEFKSLLSVELAGNIVTNTSDTFRILGPVIQDYSPKSARWGDTIRVTGNGFQNNKLSLLITATIGGIPANIVEKKNEYLKLLVPFEIKEVLSPVQIKILSLTYLLKDGFNLLSPVISSIRPKEGTWGSPITLFGKFHPDKSRNKISIGGQETTIISNSADSIKVTAPQNLIVHNNLVVNTSAPFTIVSQDTFKLFAPYIESISPLSGVSNSTVTIKGNYFLRGNNFPVVKCGSVNAIVFGISSTKCNFTVPNLSQNGPVNITITVGAQSTTFSNPFILDNPVVTKISPLTGTFNDEITIEGENLLIGTENPRIFFAESAIGPIVSASQNKIIVKVPLDADSISRPLYLNYYSIGLSFKSPQSFVLQPPVITSVTPNTITTAGQDIIISGSYFHPNSYSNEVFWDIYPLVVKSSTVSQIVATMPLTMPRINGKIIVKIRGYKTSFPITNISKSYWGRITVPSSLIWNPGAGYNEMGVAFSINGQGYMMDYDTGNMTKFDPLNNEFTDLGQFSTFYQKRGMAVAVNRDTAYLVAGSLGFFRYDLAANKWILLGPAPTPDFNGVAVSLNNKLYFGLTYSYKTYQLGKTIWNYNFSTKTWIIDNVASGLPDQSVASSFTIGNKGYVLLADSKLWRFDPLASSWTQMASYPKTLQWVSSKTTFVINDMAYVGIGDLQTNNFYQYNPLTNSWSDFTTMPLGVRYGAIAFVINSKAYLGLGILISGSTYDFYEFDPNALLK